MDAGVQMPSSPEKTAPPKKQRHRIRRRHPCPKCDRDFICKSRLADHVAAHMGEKPHSCPVCAKCFTKKVNLAAHLRVHTGEKPFSCPDCGVSYAQRSCLRRHRLSHATEKPHSCSVCGRGFIQRRYLVQHERIHTGERPFSCPLCPKRFASKSGLTEHQFIHGEQKEFTCALCEKVFTTRSSFRDHVRIHTGLKPHTCSLCGKSFNRPGLLKKHLQKHEEDEETITAVAVSIGETPHRCLVCHKLFSSAERLQHHDKLHQRALQLTCHICGRAFTRSSRLKDHIRTHTGEKPFQCDVCQRRFSMQGTLKRHQEIHSREQLNANNNNNSAAMTLNMLMSQGDGDEPRHCLVCEKTFTDAAKLRAHVKIHNKRHACSLCSKTFLKPWILRKHMTTHIRDGLIAAPADKEFWSNMQTVEEVKIKEEEEEEEEELLATPVRLVNSLKVCEKAPPSSEQHVQGEWSHRNWTMDSETEGHLHGGEQLPSQETDCLSDKHHSEYMHPASSNTKEDSETNPTSTETEKPFQSAESVESKSNTVTDTSVTEARVVTGFSTHNTELQSDATEIGDNRAPQSSEWVDTISQSADGGRTLHEQVTVELSSLVTADTDTLQPQPESQREGTSSSERHKLPAQVQPNLQPGSSTDSRSDSAASGGRQTKADQESVTKMSSGYSSLSTKLTIKTSSPPKEDEFKQRFHRVSLIPEAGSRDMVDFSGTSAESNGTVVGSEYRWRNRFDEASQYRPYNEEDSSDSPSYRTSSFTSSTSSSSLPGATSYSSLLNSDRLSDETRVYVSHESETAGEQPLGEWRRRSLVEQEEPAAPAGVREERGIESESEWIKSRWDSQEQPASLHTDTVRADDDDDESSQFTGLFKATLVQLVCEPAAPPSTPPASPDADSSNRSEMDSLVDTLKNMGPSFRPRGVGPRAAPPGLVSSLPPIVEDASSPINPGLPASLTKTLETTGSASEAQNGIYTLPPDLGLKRSFVRDSRSPLELMKEQQPGARGPTLPLRSSATNSDVIKNSSDSSTEDGTSAEMNGNGVLSPSHTASRLDNSIIFTRFRSPSLDQTGDNDRVSRPLYRSSSLPDTGPLSERMNAGPKELTEAGAGKDMPGSRFERLSILMNSSSSSSGSLTNTEDNGARMSRPPQLGFGSPPSSNSPTRLLSPTGSIDPHRSFTTTDSPLSMFGSGQAMGAGLGGGSPGTPVLQRSFSSDGSIGVQQSPMFNSFHGGSPFQSKEPEPDRNLMSKYRAFPDAYLTKEKEHGKLNPRPGKMYIFDQPGFCGQRIEIRSDVTDATCWVLQETISIRVVRGGWVLYEKPNYKGEKVALDEGDIEITNPFSPPDEEQLQNGQKEDEQKQNGETSDQQTETAPPRRFIIGSLRRAVRDYSVPEISLFPEENAEGKKVIFRDTSDDARIFGFPIKANSIIINAGLWLVFAQPFFQGVPRVLEVGGYSNPAAWGVEQPYVGSVHPLKIGEPRVENVGEPKLVIFDKPYFSGKSRTVTTNMRDFMTRVDRQQAVFMYNIGSLKVQGGIWVGYEKEGFRGHQYLLEEGEYQDWRVWGGHDSELRSVRLIQADLTDPLMVMFEQLEEDQEGMQEENTFEVTEAIPDVELFGYKTSTRSIHVISGAWIAYSHVDFSGKQYILEKGFYNNCADWGSQDTRICSLQPILLAPRDNVGARNEIILYSEPDLQGNCNIFDRNQQVLTEKFVTKSCRVVGGSWVLYEKEQYAGDLYVLNEGEYPNLASMGCPSTFPIRSVKVVPMTFSVPSLSLFGLEGLEGREITTDTEIISMTREGLNNHILSIRVNSGSWVICEHSNYRGRQFVLEPIEITNWPKFSSLNTIGSVYPVRQKRHFFRIKNKESGLFMSIQGGVEEMKSGRVVVAAEAEPMSDIWFYQDGFIKSKLTATMSLQVMGNVEPASKVVLWSETRQPSQNWTAQMSGPIRSLTFPGMVLDVKGGKSYDKEHVVIMPENEERPSQEWELELL